MFSIAHHRAIDILRRRRRDPPADPGYEETFSQEAFRATEEGLDDHVIRLDAAERIRKLLGQLSAVQREVIILAYFHGYTQSEIAAKTGQPLGTVKTRMRSALIKLREIIGSPED
jgi:RNA polymerase sigma-70 factor (ECF subfamily)